MGTIVRGCIDVATEAPASTKVIELVAQVPYQAWEQAGYVAVTHTYHDPPFACRVFDRVTKR